MRWRKAAPGPAEHRPKLLRPSLAMLRPYRGQAIAIAVVLVAGLATTLAGPALVAYAINDGLVNHHSRAVVDIAGAAYLAVTLGYFVFTRSQTRLISKVGELVLNDLRKRVFAHLLAHPLAFFEAESSGQLLSRMTADIDVLETLVQSGLGSFFTSVGLFVFSLIVLLVMSPLLFLVALACLVPVIIASLRYRVTSTRAYSDVRREIGDTLAALDEGLAGVRVIQAFRQERRLEARFQERNESQLRSELLTARLSSHFFPKVEGFGVAASAVLLGVGAVFIELHLTSVGTVAAFVLYMGNLFYAVQSLSQLFDLLQSSGAALSTVFGLLETVPVMLDPASPIALPARGALEVRDMSFKYGERSVAPLDGAPESSVRAAADERLALADVDLVIDEGEHLVLVGPTGAGKSTLAKLIGRLYDPTNGVVALGGVDLRSASLADLRRRIVVVPQEGFLFRGTVLDNVLVGRSGATEHEARQAIARLHLEERFAQFPNGLRTDVGERGSHLSAGERQLVSLARAALTDPAVLVMDEATSSLDPGTERALERALEVLVAGRTTVTVAHRLTTAERGDRVAVVIDGRLAELGTHAELVAAGGAYAELYRAWSNGAAPRDEDEMRAG